MMSGLDMNPAMRNGAPVRLCGYQADMALVDPARRLRRTRAGTGAQPG